VDFGPVPGAIEIPVEIKITYRGEEPIKVKASTTAVGAEFEPGPNLTMLESGESVFRVWLPLESVEFSGDVTAVPYETEVVIMPDSGLPSRKVRIQGGVLPTVGLFCSQCQTVNSHDSEHCRLCDESLDQAEPALPEAVRRCPQCNGLFGNVYSYCPEDGASLTSL